MPNDISNYPPAIAPPNDADNKTSPKGKAPVSRVHTSTQESIPSTPLLDRTAKISNEVTTTQRLFSALDQNDMNTFASLINNFNPLDVPKLQNEEGQTITHQAVKNQNIEAYLLLRAANDGNALAGITNQQGESVNDYITAQGDDFTSKLSAAATKQNAELYDLRVKRLFMALEQNDMPLFKNLISKLDKQRIGSLQNSEGQTITHLTIEKHNIEAFLLLRSANEGALGGIENAHGLKVSDAIKQQPPAFKQKLSAAIQEQSKSMGISQTLLLQKAHAFLNYRLDDLRKQDLPTQHVEEMSALIESVQRKGHCNGFAICWAEMFLLNIEKDYYKEVSRLRDWDEQRDTITPELTNMIDTLFQRVLFYQFDRGTVDQQIGGGGDHLLPAGQTSPLSLYLDNPDFIFPIERLTIKSDLIPLPLLSSLLQEGSTLQIGTLGTHSIAVGMKNGIYYLFDANYKGDEVDFKAEIGAVQFSTIENLSNGIRYRLYDIFGKDSKRFPGYTLSVVDLKASNHLYPTKAKIQQDMDLEKINQNKSLSPIDKFSLLLKKDINNRDILFETLGQISHDDLNKLEPSGFSFKSILSEIVESEHPLKHEMIEYFLKNEVPVLYPQENFNILETALYQKDRKAIDLILQFHPDAKEKVSEEYKLRLKLMTE